HFTGSEAKIQLAIPLVTEGGERRNFRGVLRGVVSSESGDHVAIECDGKRFELLIADIDHAKLVPDWEAVVKGKSGVGEKSDDNKPIKPGHRPSKKRPKKPDATTN